MEEVAQQLDNIVNTYSVQLLHFTEAELALKPAPDKWSKKEIIGHLIDSAQNNIRRFVVTQYETRPHIVYVQDNWVNIQNYKEYNSKELITLWGLLNKHIVVILKNMPAVHYQLQCNTGKQQKQFYTIEFLAKDYIIHHLHHLKQIVA